MHYILRFGEISLKGKNRPFFERKLRDRIKEVCPDCEVHKAGGRFYVEGPEGVNFRRVFGIVSYSPASRVGLEYGEIEGEVVEEMEGKEGAFAIQSSRLNKDYEYTSLELNQKLGQAVVDEHGLEVDLDNPDHAVGVEITDHEAFVFTERVDCFGGLPIGVEGEVAAWLDDEKSFLAALLLMKRGCDVLPFAPEEKDISLLEKYGCDEELRVGDFEDVEEADVPAVVVGDTLKDFNEYDIDKVVLRPLVGFDEDEIKKKLEEYRESSR